MSIAILNLSIGPVWPDRWMLEQDAELAARQEAMLRRKRPRRSLRVVGGEREALTRNESLDS